EAGAEREEHEVLEQRPERRRGAFAGRRHRARGHHHDAERDQRDRGAEQPAVDLPRELFAPECLDAAGPGDAHQRTLRVARPSSTSTTLMIQKRTITRGSGQPLSSKWWWIGAIRKMRLPVSLKLATCSITETVSSTNTPPITTRASSCRTITAMAPSAAPT